MAKPLAKMMSFRQPKEEERQIQVSTKVAASGCVLKGAQGAGWKAQCHMPSPLPLPPPSLCSKWGCDMEVAFQTAPRGRVV